MGWLIVGTVLWILVGGLVVWTSQRDIKQREQWAKEDAEMMKKFMESLRK